MSAAGPGLAVSSSGEPLELRFVMVGEPYPLQRHKYHVVPRPGVPPSAPLAKRVFVHEYDPAENRQWKTLAADVMRQASGWYDLTRPLWPDQPLGLVFLAYWPLQKGKERKRDPRPVSWKPSRPDGDNVLKAIQDAGNAVLWKDDAQVVFFAAAKVTAAQGEGPRLEVAIFNLREAFVADVVAALPRVTWWAVNRPKGEAL